MASLPPTAVTTRTGLRVVLRSALPDDAAPILAISRAVAAERGHTFLEPEEVDADDASLRARLARYAAHPDRIWLVAEDADGAIVGELDCEAGTHRRRLHRARLGLQVAHAHRGRGVGRAMLHAAIAWATAHPTIEKLTLGVFAGNTTAIALYESVGFRAEGVRIGDFRLGPGRYADDVAMALWVKPEPIKSGPDAIS